MGTGETWAERYSRADRVQAVCVAYAEGRLSLALAARLVGLDTSEFLRMWQAWEERLEGRLDGRGS